LAMARSTLGVLVFVMLVSSVTASIANDFEWLKATEWNWNNWRNVQFDEDGIFWAPSPECEDRSKQACHWTAKGNTVRIHWGAAGLHTLQVESKRKLVGKRDADGDPCQATFAKNLAKKAAFLKRMDSIIATVGGRDSAVGGVLSSLVDFMAGVETDPVEIFASTKGMVLDMGGWYHGLWAEATHEGMTAKKLEVQALFDKAYTTTTNKQYNQGVLITGFVIASIAALDLMVSLATAGFAVLMKNETRSHTAGLAIFAASNAVVMGMLVRVVLGSFA